MVLKVVAVIVIIFLIYILFFKRNREKELNAKKNEKMIVDEMIECASCKTYVSQKEALLGNGKFYCSKECLKNK